MLASMQAEWHSAANTRERVRIKAQTGLESQLEVFIAEINNPTVPLSQRVDAGRFLARLGELDGQNRPKSVDRLRHHHQHRHRQGPRAAVDSRREDDRACRAG